MQTIAIAIYSAWQSSYKWLLAMQLSWANDHSRHGAFACAERAQAKWRFIVSVSHWRGLIKKFTVRVCKCPWHPPHLGEDSLCILCHSGSRSLLFRRIRSTGHTAACRACQARHLPLFRSAKKGPLFAPQKAGCKQSRTHSNARVRLRISAGSLYFD